MMKKIFDLMQNITNEKIFNFNVINEIKDSDLKKIFYFSILLSFCCNY